MTSVEHLRLAHSTRILSGVFSAVLMRVEVMEATNPDTEISAAILVLSPQDPTEYPSAVG